MEIIQGSTISSSNACAHLSTKHIFYFLNQWVFKSWHVLAVASGWEQKVTHKAQWDYESTEVINQQQPVAGWFSSRCFTSAIITDCRMTILQVCVCLPKYIKNIQTKLKSARFWKYHVTPCSVCVTASKVMFGRVDHNHTHLCVCNRAWSFSWTAIVLNCLKWSLAIRLLWFNTVIAIIQTMLKPATAHPKLFMRISFCFTSYFHCP